MGFCFWYGIQTNGLEPIYMELSGGQFLPPVRTLVATIIFAIGKNAYRVLSLHIIIYCGIFISP